MRASDVWDSRTPGVAGGSRQARNGADPTRESAGFELSRLRLGEGTLEMSMAHDDLVGGCRRRSHDQDAWLNHCGER